MADTELSGLLADLESKMAEQRAIENTLIASLENVCSSVKELITDLRARVSALESRLPG
jgi:uncharacterized coiled-coil protein SlyX